MKFNKEDIEYFKNFSMINPGLLLNPGSTIKTVSRQRHILAEAQISQDIPQQFVVSELPSFLSVTKLFNDPEFDFQTGLLEISEGNRKVHYRSGQVNTITTPPDKDLPMPDTFLTFTLEKDEIGYINDMSSTLKCDRIHFTRHDQNQILINVHNKKTPNENNFTIVKEASITEHDNFNLILNVEQLKLLSGDYKAECAKTIVQLTHTTKPIRYWLATDKKSTAN